ncbi:MAG: TylF/MycF/NovP-related O-methyltransferase [Actinomycetota bacterium]|nr:TylF/MycF/NovP-related O-methyltransferase [Actinomycetota bacterium]
MSPRWLDGLQSILDTAQTAAWLAHEGLVPDPMLEDRVAVFEAMARTAESSPGRTVYLEFGVYRGDSLRWWSSRLTSADTRLFGFDTFSGVDAPWTWQTHMADFDVAGHVPQIDDARVEFVEGLFADSLPGFELPDRDRLIVVVDSDIYSSATTVLTWLAPRIRSGDLIYFDEFKFFHDERRAFAEFRDATGRRCSVLAAAEGLRSVAFVAT